ncbi:MAG: efflux RND transporter periplasmic adaptor subunit [Bacteroidales bacterium]|nr:efflux RND transporter periplasmic adaptor subunit [Bacteroidales bacterium]
MVKRINIREMKYSRLFSIIAILAVFSAGCGQQDQDGQAAGTGVDAQETQEVVVKTQPLELSTVQRTIDYTADLEAFEVVHLAPASPGRVNEIFVEPADRVKKGQKVFTMDKTQLRQAEIQLENLRTDLERLSTLLETGDIPRQQYDQLKTQVEVTESNVEFLRDNTTIYAPFSGMITGKYFENGEMYSGAPNTAAGKAAVLTLMQMNPVKAVVNISEQYLPDLNRGMEADILADVYPGETFNGRVSLVYPTVNPLTRSFEVEITLPNNDMRLKPGMFVRVAISLGQEEAYLVPSNVVIQQEGTNNRYVFVNKSGVAVRHRVQTGKRYNERIEIISDGLAEGDMIIVEGQAKLDDGDKIKVIK